MLTKLILLKRKNWVVAGFFIIILIVGFGTYKDYGIYIDEPAQRDIGQKSLAYTSEFIKNIINGEKLDKSKTEFNEFIDKDYGALFELPIELLIDNLQLKNTASAYLIRHIFVFLVFIFGVYWLYKTIKLINGDWRLGLFGALILILSPRIYGEAFYNSKDIVFLAIYSFATYGLVNFVFKRNIKALIFCAFSASLAIDVRLMALIFPALTVFFILYLWLNKEISGKYLLNYLLIFLAITIITVIIFWPFLWSSPLEHFLNALSRMSKFPRVVSMTFMGKGIYGDNLPWYYIPVWIGVTTPIFYTAMFIAGSIGIGLKLVTTYPMQLSKIQASNCFVAALFFAPILAVVLLNSNLYNGWRHLYFLYIPFVVIAITGFAMLWSSFHSKYIHLLLALLAFSTFLFQGWWIYKNHPYQYLYFNLLAGKWSQNYDVDYWGVAYPRLINKIISQNSSEKFSIFSAPESWNGWQSPYIWNLFLLDTSDTKKINPNLSEDCSNYVIGDYKKSVQYLSNINFSLFDTLKIDEQTVYSTFKRKKLLPLEVIKDKNSEILFSDSNNKCYLHSGWGGTESWGTWSTSTTAKIRLPYAPPNLHFVSLEFRPFISENVKNQPITVSVNGITVYSTLLDRQRSIKVPIPAKHSADDFWEVSIEIPRATSPKSVGLSDDVRPLGLGLIKASYE